MDSAPFLLIALEQGMRLPIPNARIFSAVCRHPTASPVILIGERIFLR
jgi:hypothetical protein